MQTSIILLLLFWIVMAATGYYFGFVKPQRFLDWLSKAGFVFSTFFMIPFVVVVLWMQSSAVDRLSRTGITPHPSIVEAVGIAVGWGKNPTWMFKVEAPSESIREFYRAEENRVGWTIVEDGSAMLILKRAEQEMVIAGQEDWTSRTVIYMLTEQ